jgi:hypothetical protein
MIREWELGTCYKNMERFSTEAFSVVGQSDFHRNLGSSPRVRVDGLFNGMLQDKLLGFLNFGLHLSTASVLQVFE